MSGEDYIVVEANTYEEAVTKALKALNKRAEEVRIEIIEQPKKLFNMMIRPYKIRVSLLVNAVNEAVHVDGSFVLEYKDDGVYLTVNPPQGNGRPVDERLIVERIKRKNIQQLDNKAVFSAIASNDGRAVKIAPAQLECVVDAEVVVWVSPDGMEAYMRILPEDGGKPCDIAMVKKALSEMGICYGIDWNTIADVLNNNFFEQDVLIAKGTKPIDGQDGRVEYTVALEADAKPRILEDGTVDYKHLDIVKNVRKGDVLAKRLAPTAGVPGCTVLGKKIPAKDGKKINIPAGKNVELANDGELLLSAIDGQVVVQNGKISVFPVYEVIGDVDNSTGNIEFVGNVKVKGNVRAGFTVKAEGDVEVFGVVEGASISAGGNIVLRSGVQGMNKAVLKAGGDIAARFVENSVLEAGRNIAADAIMHSYIRAGKTVTADGRRGLIVGGSIKAALEINARNIGSSMAAATELEVGIDPQLREQYNDISAKMEDLKRQLKACDQDIQAIARLEARGTISADKQRLKLLRIQKKLTLVQEIAEIKARLMKLEEMMEQLSQGTINVSGTIYPGVKITIGSSSLNIMEEFHYATFKRQQGEVVMTVYEKKRNG